MLWLFELDWAVVCREAASFTTSFVSFFGGVAGGGALFSSAASWLIAHRAESMLIICSLSSSVYVYIFLFITI